MKIPTTNEIKKIYWDKAKGNIFSARIFMPNFKFFGFDISKLNIELSVVLPNNDENSHIIARILFDGIVYEAPHYGFSDLGCVIEPQLDYFLSALEKTYPHLFFELYNYSIIDITLKE